MTAPLTARVLDVIRSCGDVGATVSDVAALLDVEPRALWPTMTRLSARGAVRQSGRRMGQTHHRRAAVWSAL